MMQPQTLRSCSTSPLHPCGGRQLDWARLAVSAALALGCGAEAPADPEPSAPEYEDEACAIMTCPEGLETCCTETFVTGVDRDVASYARRDDLVLDTQKTLDGIHVDLSFDAAGQSSRIVFNLGRNVSIYNLSFVGSSTGVVESYVSVFMSDAVGRGCVFGFEIPPSAMTGEALTAQQTRQIELVDDEYCYNGGRPGRGSVLELGVRSAGPGAASFEVIELTLESIDELTTPE